MSRQATLCQYPGLNAVSRRLSCSQPVAELRTQCWEQVLRAGKDIGQLQLAMSSGGQQATFGRVPSCDVVLEHASISRHHATLALDHGHVLTITDNASGVFGDCCGLAMTGQLLSGCGGSLSACSMPTKCESGQGPLQLTGG